MKKHDPKTNSEILFFLGAGASMKAGVPNTKQFVDDFISEKNKKLDNEEDKKVYNFIKEVLEVIKREKEGKYDLEVLLELLDDLNKLDKKLIGNFFKPIETSLEKYEDIPLIINKFKEFIVNKCIVDQNKIKYLGEFYEFLREYGYLDIFTVNYDICIELFCNLYKLNYTDGFDLFWNPGLFDEGKFQIKLYKIHGSIIWYVSNRKTYVKIPLIPQNLNSNLKISDFNLITDESISPFLLYPLNKFEFYEPSNKLLSMLKDKLSQTKFIFVIGYSFRDISITKVFWTVAKEKTNLIVFLIDPNAEEIYRECVRFDKENKVFSFLNKRVICLSYNFELIFPYLRNQYIRNLQLALLSEKKTLENRRSGLEFDWKPTIEKYLDCEYYERVEDLIRNNEIDWKKEFPFDLRYKYLWKFIIFYLFMNSETKYREYFNELKQFIKQNLTDKLKIDIITTENSGFQLTLSFILKNNVFYPQNVMTKALNFSNVKFCIENKIKSNIKKDFKLLLYNYIRLFKKINEYVSFWGQDNRINYNKYTSDRKQYAKVLIENSVTDFKPPIPSENQIKQNNEKSRLEIEKIEKFILNELLFKEDNKE